MGISTKIIVPVNGHTKQELDGAATKSFVSWNRLMPQLKQAVTMKGNEEIVGLEVADDGVTVVLNYKD